MRVKDESAASRGGGLEAMHCRWFYFGPNSAQSPAKKDDHISGPQEPEPDGFSRYFLESRQGSTSILASGVS